jgi:hypothetical protein
MRTVENISCEDGHSNKLEGLSTGTIIANFDQKSWTQHPKKYIILHGKMIINPGHACQVSFAAK